MTRILDRYVARQIMTAAIFAICILLIILILGNLFKDILTELADRPELDLKFVLKFVGLVIPMTLGIAIPFSFLTAILLTFGKLSADSELVSMRMAGQSMARISMPVWGITLFFTAICAWINLSLMPWAKTEGEGMKGTLINRAKESPLMLIQDEKVMSDVPGYLIYAKKRDGQLDDFQIVHSKGAEPVAIALAKHADFTFDPEKNELVVDMEAANLLTKRGNQAGAFTQDSAPAFVDRLPMGISFAHLSRQEKRLQPENLAFFDLLHLVMHGPKGSKLVLQDEVLTDDRIALKPKVKTSLETELSMRLAFSMSCITFALIGVPLGITAQRKETTAGFGMALGIGAIYFALLNFALIQRESPELYPHILVWLPNIIFISLGLFLFIRVSRK